MGLADSGTDRLTDRHWTAALAWNTFSSSELSFEDCFLSTQYAGVNTGYKSTGGSILFMVAMWEPFLRLDSS